MTYKNTNPMLEDHNQAIKAVVSGSAADIIKAMHQVKQSTVENASLAGHIDKNWSL